MKTTELVEQYILAWNRRNATDLLALMHKGAAYYDAFWMESCVGRELIQYFQDSFDEEPYWYEQIDDTIDTESGVVFRYSAHESSDSNIGETIYFGAEMLTLRDGLIVTISDHYCHPDRTDLVEVARLAAKRHGLTSHTKAGLSAQTALRVRTKLSMLVDQDEAQLNSSLTVSQLADQIGCTVSQLLTVIDAEYGTHFEETVNHNSTIYARDILSARPGGTQ